MRKLLKIPASIRSPAAAIGTAVLALGLAGPISPAQAAACNCHPGLRPCPIFHYCKVGGCAGDGANVGRCTKSGGGSGDPKSPTNSFSAEPRQKGAKTKRPRRLQAR